MRYIITNVKHLRVTTKDLIINKKEFIILFVHLIESKPWLIERDGRFIFEDNEWIKVQQLGRIPVIECNCWLSLYCLINNQDFMQQYELTGSRKDIILRLKKYINEIIIDSIPLLKELQKTLEYLSIMKQPLNTKSKELLIEPVSDIDNYIKSVQFEYKQLQQTEEDIKIIQQLSSFWTSEDILTTQNTIQCNYCKKICEKRCARCK